ncbi:MAG: tryptophan synthase subunit alpha, partial [Hydrogenovibrio sp.]|nr:tryptophan synthase subunit alpha [Hydrogenovibrio sp.]
DRRLQAVNEQGSGFVYYVSLKGVTGSKALDVADVTYHVNHLKTHLSLPVGIGFGISNGEAAYQMAKVGDAIIVGSALVNLIEQNMGAGKAAVVSAISEKMAEFRQAIDRADSE